MPLEAPVTRASDLLSVMAAAYPPAGRLSLTRIRSDDDREEVIERRLRVYERDTRPLIDHYRARGLLRAVDASGPTEQVYLEFLRTAGGT